MWNAGGTIGVSGEFAGGTLIFEFFVSLKNHLCYSAACGLGSRTRRRSAVGEEGFEVLCFFLELGLSKVLFLSR